MRNGFFSNAKWFVCNLVKKLRFLLGAIQNFHQTVAVSLDNRDFTIQESFFTLIRL